MLGHLNPVTDEDDDEDASSLGILSYGKCGDQDDDDDFGSLLMDNVDNMRRGRKRSTSLERYPRRTGHGTTLRRR